MSEWETVIAAYAALVATAVLALEVRRWFESGARLVVNTMPKAKTFNIPGTEDKRYLLVTVVNRGSAPTTITHLVLFEFKHPWDRWRDRPSQSAFVADPRIAGQAPNIPAELQPGGRWQGIVNHDDELEEWIATGNLYAGVYGTHSDRPALTRVRKIPSIPDDAKRM